MTAIDNDKIGFDVIGTYEIDINKIKTYEKWQYIHIYGAPLNHSGKFFDLMNENAEIGSLWKGKILMRMECDESSSSPKSMVSPMDPTIAQSAGSYLKTHSTKWTLAVTLFGAFFLPDNKKYGLSLKDFDVADAFGIAHYANKVLTER